MQPQHLSLTPFLPPSSHQSKIVEPKNEVKTSSRKNKTFYLLSDGCKKISSIKKHQNCRYKLSFIRNYWKYQKRLLRYYMLQQRTRLSGVIRCAGGGGVRESKTNWTWNWGVLTFRIVGSACYQDFSAADVPGKSIF